MGVDMEVRELGHGGIIYLSMSYVVGIDEAGRGPLAGPVAVGVAQVYKLDKFKKLVRGIKDSKQLSPEERELWYALALESKKEGVLDFAVSLVSEKIIDRKGIVHAIKVGIKRCFKKLAIEEDSQIFLDGSLKAPEQFKHQRTIIKGDEKMPIISLASIVAKVTRDRLMVKISKKFPAFNFHLHKGYGTDMHREALKKYGSTVIHRQSFLKHLTVSK